MIASARAGASMLTGYFEEDELVRMGKEARQATLVRRRIDDWHNTSRATFFTKSEGGSTALVLASRVLQSAVWVPKIHEVAVGMARTIRDFGQETVCAPLASYQPNRIGVNLLRGSLQDPALIPRHRDVSEETGVVVAIEMGDGHATALPVGTMTLILGADTCEYFGISQHWHEVTSSTRRYGITIAQLTD
jgi:hypothetical protein